MSQCLARIRRQQLGAIRCAVVVVHGAIDPLVDVSGGEATAKAIHGAELVVIEDMGHELPSALFRRVVETVVHNIRRE